MNLWNMFDCLSNSCNLIGGTHVVIDAEFLINNQSVSIRVEIPNHGSKELWENVDYQYSGTNDHSIINTFTIKWGSVGGITGLIISIPREYEKFLRAYNHD